MLLTWPGRKFAAPGNILKSQLVLRHKLVIRLKDFDSRSQMSHTCNADSRKRGFQRLSKRLHHFVFTPTPLSEFASLWS
jgi:hypothetical protein